MSFRIYDYVKNMATQYKEQEDFNDQQIFLLNYMK